MMLRNILALAIVGAGLARAAAVTSEISSGWTLRLQTGLGDAGTVISQPGYNTAGWYPITAPCTVMAGLLTNNVYTNVFFGTNLQAVPDLTTPNWWYRDQFVAPTNSGGQFWLRFKGIAYRAKIWVNGTQVFDGNDYTALAAGPGQLLDRFLQ